MKRLMATLLLATMILSGCGNNAAQKVEEKAQEVKKEAAQTVQEKAADVEQKAAEVKQEAEKVAQDAGNAANQKAVELVDATKSLFKSSREIPLAGILPGVTLEKIIEAFGEPTFRDGDEVTFSNGMEIDLKDNSNVVEKVTVTTPNVKTPEGVEVGMSEYILNETYGPADKVEVDDGKVEYKYYSRDNAKEIEFTSRGGIITEISTKIRD